jgi:SAM-dependent methyltransferase
MVHGEHWSFVNQTMTAFDYDQYVRAEWGLFSNNPMRASASLAALKGCKVTRVLDVGCGAGQEMTPFVVELGAFGVGLDIAPGANRVGRALFAAHHPAARVVFIRAAAEVLPLLSKSCDVVICRIALPYTDNQRALAEMARVLCPGGVLLLKIHHARYYGHMLLRGAAAFDVRSMIYASRVLATGAFYHATGRQPRTHLKGKEVFQTRWLLRRELLHQGLSITGELPDSTPQAPSFIISKL